MKYSGQENPDRQLNKITKTMHEQNEKFNKKMATIQKKKILKFKI